jgi:type IX secretion system PorP/SprF family membrane protein
MKKSYLIFAFLFLTVVSKAQQDPMFTKYMFNTLIFNPAYAGSKEHMSATVLHRTQWIGLEGAPTTQTITLHTPLKGNRVAIGGSLLHDNIGPTKDIKLSGYYAYRINFNETSKLSFGVSATYNNWRTDFSQLNLNSPIDPAFSTYSRNLFNAGAGIFYYNKNFYAGLSVPHLLNGSLIEPDRDVAEEELQAIQIRHYYLAAGLILPLNSNLTFKPSVLIKNSNLFGEFGNNVQSNVGAPTEFDIDLSLLMYDALWVGVAFRSAFEYFSEESSTDSFDIWMAYYLRNNMTIGVAYDFSTNDLDKVNSGSFEVILGYDFAYKTSSILTPRYFF